MSDPQIDARIDELARAYRDVNDGSSDGALTRARLLRAHRERRAQRSWLLAAAALLLGLVSIPTAWALYTGRIFGAEDGAPVIEPAAPRIAPPRERVAPAPITEPAESLEAALPTSPAASTTPAIAPRPTRPAIEEARIEETPATEESPAIEETPIDPAERLAYEEAHALHFDARDAAGAVTAWERYLARYPRGRFAPEARYNRALSLVRLGRRDEAIEALRPFSAGELGSYRRREATELLQALETP